jgi:hypothetical protein
MTINYYRAIDKNKIFKMIEVETNEFRKGKK